MKRIRQYADEAGIVAFVIVSIVAVWLAAAVYFGAPEAVDQIEGGPGVPLHDAEMGRGPDMPRGGDVGAASASLSPTSYLETQGITYAFYASPNWSSRNIGDTVEAVVIHVASGSCPGMRSWFANPSSQVSAHFGVCKGGDVDQYVDLGASAWHAGICNRPTAIGNKWCGAGVNPNRRTIGIELELKPGERIEDYPAMQTSLTVLLQWLLENYDLEANRNEIIAHADIDSVNRSIDPHCCADLNAIIAAAGEGPKPAGCAPTPCWDGTQWHVGGGWTWNPEPAPCGAWGFKGETVWSRGDPRWGGREIPGIGWVPGGAPLFSYIVGDWITAPECSGG